MIIKEIEPFRGTDKFQIAGRQAEEQMAFYLRRYFANSNDVYVINNLSLGKDGESLQIDHLVIHQNGLIIIESKSVSGQITITNDMQWIRRYEKFSTGMKSPIIQVEMQKMLLTSIIDELKSEGHRNLQIGEIDILIAISDNGIINWPAQGKIEGVYKAENICKRIQDILNKKQNYKKISDDDIKKLEQDIRDLKITSPSQTEFLDSQGYLRGHHPQWIAEFFYDCHLAHLCLKKGITPEIIENIKNEHLNNILENLDAHEKRKLLEFFTYKKIFNEKYKKLCGYSHSIMLATSRDKLSRMRHGKPIPIVLKKKL